MFGRKERIEQLEAHLLQAHEENARLKANPYFTIAQNIANEARNTIGELEVEAAVQAAIVRERERLRAQFVGAIVAKRVREIIEDEKAVITAEAEAAAQEEIEARLVQFRTEEALTLLEEKKAAIREKSWAKLLHEEKKNLQEQALQELRTEARAAAEYQLSHGDYRDNKEYNKARAAEIRKITKRTRVLDITALMAGDMLEVVFVTKGKGLESLTEYDSYNSSSTPRTDLIKRTLELRLADPEEGIAVAEEDSWLKTKPDHSLYPMTPVKIEYVDRLEGELLPGINKAAPLLMSNQADVRLPGHELDVWYVNLNGYRALS